nr:2-methoxy-6-polyprenyl-1,4-benzoquinol methylase [Ipomoea batatas]
MDVSDADMMEAEHTAAQPSPPPQGLPSNSDHEEAVRNLLAMARQLIDQNKPSQALQAVVMAMRTRGGEEAVCQVLSRARQLYSNKVQASAAADELASLFAECAIAEAIPPRPGPSESNKMDHPTELELHGTSILTETGRKQVMLDALSDGSSFICLQCGGLVNSHRREEHYSLWCL